MLYSLDQAIQAIFHKKVYEYQAELSKALLTELNLEETLDKDITTEGHRELVKAFEGEKISTTTALLGGLKNTMDGFVREEMTKRSLDTLATDFL